MTASRPASTRDDRSIGGAPGAGLVTSLSLSRAVWQSATSRVDPVPPCPLDEEISRAEAAYQLMLVADTCLKAGADQLLLLLGFTQQHIADLRNRAGPRGGYPGYSLRNIKQTLRLLRKTRESGQ